MSRARRSVPALLVVFAACGALSPLAASGAPAPAASGIRLVIAPVPTRSNRAPGTPQVSWSTGDGSPGLVTVVAADGTERPFASGSDGSQPAPWIAYGMTYAFRLYATGVGKRLLARTTVGAAVSTPGVVVAPQQDPPNTSPAVDRLLQLLPYAGLIVLAGLGLASLRRDG